MIGRSWSLLLITFLLIGVSLSEVDSGPALTTVAEADEPKVINSNSLKPNPNYSPADVIRIQLQALSDNNHPYENAGIEVAFRFASPANKGATGPLDRFIQMVHNPAYRPMLNHQAVFYGELQVKGIQAAQAVILTTSSGERVGYVFTLSKQEGDTCRGCWMTDGVLRFKVKEELRET
jgi:hypothetical protein